METSNNDCYFFYYSTCSKGSSCGFRHEPSAQGKEEMCEEWEYGRCVKSGCSKRHMLINTKRSDVQCYWETQPGGCQKPHCVFKHSKSGNNKFANSINLTAGVTARLKNDDIPSPKVDPILININDTDEESPQKVNRMKPVINKQTHTKKINLKNIKNQLEGVSNGQETDHAVVRGNEILNRVNQGVLDVFNKETLMSTSQQKEEIKVKSLKDIKREKILRARLEREKKLLALNSAAKVEKKSEKQPVIIQKSTNGVTIIKPATRKIRQLYKPKKPDSDSSNHSTEEAKAIEDKSIQANKPVEEVKILTFEEIMEAKRKRKQAEQLKYSGNKDDSPVRSPVSTDTTTTKELADAKPIQAVAPVIPIKHIKIRKRAQVTESKEPGKPVKIRRTVPTTIREGAQVLTTKETTTITEHLAESATQGDQSANLTCPQLNTVVSAVSEEENDQENLAKIGNSVNSSVKEEADEEFDLLGSSAHLMSNENSSASPIAEIDDDELFNEMEELLA